jgi:simple sugar transport system permease protein
MGRGERMSGGRRRGIVPAIEVDISAREDVPAWLAYGTPVFTILAALSVGGVALLALGVNPIAAYERMFVNTLTDAPERTRTLLRAVPLVLTGLAVYLPLRAGLWNIGAEGQLYLGAITGTWIGLNVSQSPVVLLPLSIFGGALAGGVWGLIPGYLRARRGVNEIIATLMLTFIGVRLAEFLVNGPMQGGLGNIPRSGNLPAAAQLPAVGLPGFEETHAGVLIALAAVVFVWLLLTRTERGFEIAVTGSNADAARQAGMNTGLIYVFVLALGGALAGLAGAIEMTGVEGRLYPEFSPGYGFTAIPIALLGRRGALRIGVAGLFFALLFVGGANMEFAFDIPAAIVEVIQALVILFLITAEFFKRYRITLRRVETPGPAAAAGEGD